MNPSPDQPTKLEYQIVSTLQVRDLVPKVNDLIKNGWKPFGCLVVSDLSYHQPMTKENQ
jgi:hypothetical protein